MRILFSETNGFRSFTAHWRRRLLVWIFILLVLAVRSLVANSSSVEPFLSLTGTSIVFKATDRTLLAAAATHNAKRNSSFAYFVCVYCDLCELTE